MNNNEKRRIISDQGSLQHHLSQPPNQKKRNEEDDSLENADPNDSRADEKVIVNEQVGNKTVNAPSQTAVNSSEGISSDEETINQTTIHTSLSNKKGALTAPFLFGHYNMYY